LKTKATYQSINQPINQSINQPINIRLIHKSC